MTEETIFQAIHQLTFNLIMRGIDPDEAVKKSEKTIVDMIAVAKKIHSENIDSTEKTV